MKHKMIALAMCAALTASCQKSLEEKAADDAREYTARECPREIAEDIRQDSMAFDKDSRTLVYYYTLQGRLDDKQEQQRHTDEYAIQLRQSVNSAPSLKNYVDAGFRFRYVYRSEKNGETILDLTI